MTLPSWHQFEKAARYTTAVSLASMARHGAAVTTARSYGCRRSWSAEPRPPGRRAGDCSRSFAKQSKCKSTFAGRTYATGNFIFIANSPPVPGTRHTDIHVYRRHSRLATPSMPAMPGTYLYYRRGPISAHHSLFSITGACCIFIYSSFIGVPNAASRTEFP